MNILAKLFGYGDSDSLPPFFPVVHIYHNDTTVVVTANATVGPLNVPKTSFHRFPRNVDKSVLGPCVIECMAAADINMPEGAHKQLLSDFCAFMNVSSRNRLEFEYNYIQVLKLSPSEFEIYEFQKCTGGGYGSDRKPIRLPADGNLVGRQIVTSIESTDDSYYDDGSPSHT